MFFFLKVAASSRFASNIKMLLNETSAESWIGRGGPMNWPAHSHKLTSTDFFMGSYASTDNSEGWEIFRNLISQ